MGVIFEPDEPIPGIFTFIGKTVSFDMDYFGTRRVFATVEDNKTKKRYHIYLSLGHQSTNDRYRSSGARIIITTLNGQGRLNNWVRKWSLNKGYVTFDYIQYINNEGRTMTGYISHNAGKKAYIGFKTMTMRRR